MTKRPKSVRIKPDKTKRIFNEVCFRCNEESEELISVEIEIFDEKEQISRVEVRKICPLCFENHCEICDEEKLFITVRRNPNDNTQNYKQICSDCYEELCRHVVRMDSEYGN